MRPPATTVRSWGFLVLLVLTLGLSCPAEEYGDPFPEWWRTQVIPRPTADFRRFDEAAFERWCKAQPPEAKQVIEFVRSNLTHVTQKEFEAELLKTFQKFNSERGDTRPLLFVTFSKFPEPVKSGIWATALLREMDGKGVGNAAFFNMSVDFAKASREKLREVVAAKKYRVVVVDDAVYSGAQMADALTGIAPYVDAIDVIVPFATKASDRLHLNPGFNIPVRFHRGQTIASADDLVEKLPAAQREAFKEATNVRDLFPPNHTLTYFDHKMPDFFSFPAWIGEGQMLTTEPFGKLRPMSLSLHAQLKKPGEVVKIPFLQEGFEPYRVPCVKVPAAVAKE